MTPADHGYLKCIRCGTWRQPEWLTWEGHDTSRRWCQDVAWCSAMAGMGKGELDADTGEVAGNLPGTLQDDAWTKGNVP